MSYCTVFERKEIKYRITERQLRAVLSALEGRMAPDRYGCTQVMSLYVDTPERLLIERSLDKPLYKEKLRLRSYGVPKAESQVFVEIKKKYDGVVYKRRVGMSYAAARAYLGGMSYVEACRSYPLPTEEAQAESLEASALQIAREIDAFIVRYSPLVPSMLITCARTAFAPVEAPGLGTAAEGAEDVPSDLRITIDRALSYTDLFVQRDVPHRLIGTNEAIMEIKNQGPYPLWLTHALSHAGIRPSSFSKYGEAYRACADRTGAPSVPGAPALTPVPKEGGRCA